MFAASLNCFVLFKVCLCDFSLRYVLPCFCFETKKGQTPFPCPLGGVYVCVCVYMCGFSVSSEFQRTINYLNLCFVAPTVSFCFPPASTDVTPLPSPPASPSPYGILTHKQWTRRVVLTFVFCFVYFFAKKNKFVVVVVVVFFV